MTVGNDIYPSFIDGELRTERERRANLEARGVSVVSQSGGLVTLLLGVAAFTNDSSALPSFGIGALVAGLILFLGAGLCGILVNFWPIYPAHPVADAATMKQMATTKRFADESEARTVISHINIGTIASLRRGNDKKIRFVAIAQMFQVLAVIVVSVAVVIAITR